MTAVAAWIRELKPGIEEVCIISDSRLSGGQNIDCAPKLFPLARGDIALAFAGETFVAYPFLQQIYFTSLSYRSARTRGLDIIEYRPHVLKVLNNIVENIETPIEDLRIPDCTFLLCGYSWIKKRFYLWTIKFNSELNRFHYDGAGRICGRSQSIIFGGDAGPSLKRETNKLLTERRGRAPWTTPLGLEPLEALSSMLQKNDPDVSIGGPPQFVKIYQHSNATIIPIFWPLGQTSSISYLGRMLQGYEKIDDWIFSLDTLDRQPPP